MENRGVEPRTPGCRPGVLPLPPVPRSPCRIRTGAFLVEGQASLTTRPRDRSGRSRSYLPARRLREGLKTRGPHPSRGSETSRLRPARAPGATRCVWTGGFEPPVSWSQTTRVGQTTLRPGYSMARSPAASTPSPSDCTSLGPCLSTVVGRPTPYSIAFRSAVRRSRCVRPFQSP